MSEASDNGDFDYENADPNTVKSISTKYFVALTSHLAIATKSFVALTTHFDYCDERFRCTNCRVPLLQRKIL